MGDDVGYRGLGGDSGGGGCVCDDGVRFVFGIGQQCVDKLPAALIYARKMLGVGVSHELETIM